MRPHHIAIVLGVAFMGVEMVNSTRRHRTVHAQAGALPVPTAPPNEANTNP